MGEIIMFCIGLFLGALIGYVIGTDNKNNGYK